MLNFIKSLFFRQPDPELRMLSKRSGKWTTVRKKYLAENPTCAACGGTKDLSVHHVVPLHLDDTKELDPNNLITLCEENNCHHTFGHLFSWFSYNPKVREDAAAWLEKIKTRPKRTT